MRREPIALVWVVGIILTVCVYLVGADRFLHFGVWLFADLDRSFRALMDALTISAFELIRALALGLFAVFVALGVIAARRGLRARAALVTVSLTFLLLLYPALDGAYVSTDRWFGAFILAGIGAIVMTRRLAAGLRPVPA